LPSLSRVGLGRLIYSNAYADLPTEVRNQERALLSTSRHARSVRDEFSELPTALKQAGELKTLGDMPLIVVTADKDAETGWQPLQDELATLSSNSTHIHVPDATHSMLAENEGAAEASSLAIRDVVKAVRTETNFGSR
jgi:hypothetical protein